MRSRRRYKLVHNYQQKKVGMMVAYNTYMGGCLCVYYVHADTTHPSNHAALDAGKAKSTADHGKRVRMYH